MSRHLFTAAMLVTLVLLTGCRVGPDPEATVLIPAGEFTMGYDKGETDETPVRKVKLKAFLIDKFPVTYGRYQRFVVANRYAPPRDWNGKPEAPSGKSLYPVVHVYWSDAVAFCKWEGKRLPSEEEWEKAARGTDGRLYPWGNEFDRSRSNISGDGTLRVGSYASGASPYGVMEMVGSVWQWTASPHQPDDDNRILRGPPYSSKTEEGRVTMRQSYSRQSQAINIGFRCAADAPAGTAPSPS